MHLTDLELGEYVAGAKSPEDKRRARVLIRDRCYNWWTARAKFRDERREGRNEFRGRQYEYEVRNDEGVLVKAKDFIENQGRITIALNLVANNLKNLHGQFLSNKSERGVFATSRAGEEEILALNMARRATRRRNGSHVIEADNALEHFLSGASCFKSLTEWDSIRNRHEVTDGKVDQTRLFFNQDIQDRRLKGLNLIGELHDLSMHQIVSVFAKSTKEAEEIKAKLIMGRDAYANAGLTQYGHFGIDGVNFFVPNDPALERIVETWFMSYDWVRFGYDPLFQLIDGYGEITLNDADLARVQNKRRADGLPLLELDDRKYEPAWRYMFLTPDAELIGEGTTPYWHGEHPYTVGLATWLDQETWGVISDIKDPQRWLNRLISQIDHSITVSGKGALGIDEQVLENSTMTEEEILDNYSRADGVVKLMLGNKTWDQAMRQLQHGQLNSGVFDLIPMLVGFVERISGINEASQGLAPKAGTPASLYERQVVQSSINSFSALSSYLDELHLKDRKELQNIQQSHQEMRTISEGKGIHQLTVEYDPRKVQDIDVDIAIGDVEDTVTQRQQGENLFHQLAQTGVLPIEVYLSLISHPRAQEALDMMTQMNQQQADQENTVSPATEEAMQLLERTAA